MFIYVTIDFMKNIHINNENIEMDRHYFIRFVIGHDARRSVIMVV